MNHFIMPQTVECLCDLLFILCIVQLVYTSTLAFKFGGLLELIKCKFVTALGVISALVSLPTIILVRNEKDSTGSTPFLQNVWYQRYALCVCIIMYAFAKLVAFNAIIWSAKHSLVFGDIMKGYLKAIENKQLADYIQILLHCCGANGYTDWFMFNWISTTNTTNGEEFMEFYKPLDFDEYPSSYDNYTLDSVPFSCCSLSILEPCLHDDILLHGIETINQKGCGKSLEEFTLFLLTSEVIFYTIGTCLEVCLIILLKRKKFLAQSPPKSENILQQLRKSLSPEKK